MQIDLSNTLKLLEGIPDKIVTREERNQETQTELLFEIISNQNEIITTMKEEIDNSNKQAKKARKISLISLVLSIIATLSGIIVLLI